MTISAEGSASRASFEVGVAIQGLPTDGTPEGVRREPPGYDEASGMHEWRSRVASRLPVLIEKGEDAVRMATEAIAGQIGMAAQNIAAAIELHAPPPEPGVLELESVEVSFGITLAAGVQALFTTQAESSAQVTITLSRSPSAPEKR